MEYTEYTKAKEVKLMKNTVIFQTLLGAVGISEQDGAITEFFFAKDTQDSVSGQATLILKEAQKQFLGYLAGNRKTFDLPFAAEGTKFQKTVWEALRSIPYGETRSYKQVAEMIGQPDASRAVGMANNKNPILILTPCHRVLGSDSKLVGYAAGLDIKKQLLELEKSHFNC
ncbi:MAG: O-6-methylguanine methyltransferase [Herbinix sp.]|jgi:methylated-DNA-[protein]-cysteine S-methyltransferase|nr:O-6-methylguanine methyltransferase [Herbinix sp.]